MAATSKSWFTFVVRNEATKPVIKSEIENLYGVSVKEIKITKVRKGSRRNPKNRRLTLLAPVKKATVRLSEGQKIDLFETASEAKTA